MKYEDWEIVYQLLILRLLSLNILDYPTHLRILELEGLYSVSAENRGLHLGAIQNLTSLF